MRRIWITVLSLFLIVGCGSVYAQEDSDGSIAQAQEQSLAEEHSELCLLIQKLLSRLGLCPVPEPEQRPAFADEGWGCPIDGLTWGMTREEAAAVYELDTGTAEYWYMLEEPCTLYGRQMQVELFIDECLGLQSLRGSWPADAADAKAVAEVLKQQIGPVLGESEHFWSWQSSQTVGDFFSEEEIAERYKELVPGMREDQHLLDLTVFGKEQTHVCSARIQESEGSAMLTINAGFLLFVGEQAK